MGVTEPPEPVGPDREPVMLPALFGEVDDVRRLALRPGDIVVLRLASGTSGHAADELAQRAEAIFPGHKVVVLGPGVDIGVLGPD